MAAENTIEVKVPDIGDFKDLPIIEILVKVGDTIKADESLLTVESDKATMDVPSPVAGVVAELKVKVGDAVSQGSLVALLTVTGDAPTAPAPVPAKPAPAPAALASSPAPVTAAPVSPPGPSASLHMPTPAEIAAEARGGHMAHASPSVRAYARELGVDVSKVGGTGPKGRVLQSDVQAYVKGIMTGGAASAGASGGGMGLNLLPWPKIDFAKFGPVETKPLSRIQKISGANLARNWAMIPHVTQFDEADITDLDAFRVAMNKENEKSGNKVTMLAFLIKASVVALKKFPAFNASLDGQGDEMRLVMKQYFHIGFAADTPNGLVVPVVRDADRKGVLEIAREMGELAKKAREGKLAPAEMQGGCFSISSLGGIGGTAFTPIINAPEVAILGVSKTQTKPVWDGKTFVPRQMLPLSLSYDHRVIDGAAAARFTSTLAQLLADMRRSLL
jgi:pyruvate dehydrogenase E2 component (dihydrolipoamide acetyltransferase)